MAASVFATGFTSIPIQAILIMVVRRTKLTLATVLPSMCGRQMVLTVLVSVLLRTLGECVISSVFLVAIKSGGLKLAACQMLHCQLRAGVGQVRFQYPDAVA